ncbi:hypothetical protein ABEJ11_004446 [Shigella flexneri]
MFSEFCGLPYLICARQNVKTAAREAERGREAWTLGQGMKKPVAGCYGRLMRWKGGGDVVYMALL